ncbi:MULTISPECIES: Hfq-related RNA-binding protein [unclassified Coleofasciculus]|uniref:Hfq-related RNA-binding protein n=1 Tax=unclassified Coleofasciculus TaxID=2692782 RepID=UPI001880F062|nr:MULTISPECIES: RNA-binding protein hfq [unclassified Coleofasciculus]MBE9129372.1 RNA-binding protein hfq [Coleofasciculus sp. LEGE 07081]MBE9152006.1 RNA-binding protein hfq [Coleofasciculus sp. LEGE 07092]
MTEFQTGTPSVRQIQGFIKEATEVELKLITNDLLIGRIRWQDQDCLCFLDEADQPIIIWHHAIAYIKPKNGAGGNRSLQVFESHEVMSAE